MTEEERKQKRKEYYQLHKEEKKEKSRQYYLAHREEIKEYKKEYHKKRKDIHKEICRKNDLKRKFGITIDDYKLMLEKQNYCCLICGTHRNEFNKDFAVDHNHKTGNVRGLLCGKCNQGLGKFNDNIELLEKAINYLNNFL